MTVMILLVTALTSPLRNVPATWQLSVGETGCIIQRSYGGSTDASFGVEADVSEMPWLFVIGASKTLPDGIGETRITVQPGGATYDVHYGSLDTQKNRVKLVRLFPDQQTLAIIASASRITLGKKGRQLAVEGLNGALGAVRDCTAKLVTSWGADPSLYLDGKLARLGNLGRWYGVGDDPHPQHYGKVVILIHFGTDGKPNDCRAVLSPDPALSDAPCRVAMQHATATMPLDDTGKPLSSYAVTTVIWTRP